MPFAASAQDAVRQFAAELQLHESQQVLHADKPVRYVDGEAGARLQRLLDPSRAAQVLDDMVAAILRGDSVPDLGVQMRPMASRYLKAFDQWPVEYENEYLDVQFWSVQITKRALANVAVQGPGADSSSAPASSQWLASGRSLLLGVARVMELAMRQKIESGVLSPGGSERALVLVNELAGARGEPAGPR
ncbi:hypothetical protein [Ramlibacter tataouinensis]|uniref:Uncharacterized protein n=1 Tax=Ramlibacter tataouinensis TaxID=94132 RepID=A0A127JRH4_9BURK|nr:hypothetical protein [Ramlibacter tataouinensis]AMO22566.1 hypothetical protein UC35_06295 [Ramlibacter tataouinensis]